jgi:hypothetical protein
MITGHLKKGPSEAKSTTPREDTGTRAVGNLPQTRDEDKTTNCRWTNPAFERTKKPAHLRFDPPIGATCVTMDGTYRADCLVVAIGEFSAQLEIDHGRSSLNEFFLIFTPGLNPVFRRCKTVSTRGKQVIVEFRPTSASFQKHMEER